MTGLPQSRLPHERLTWNLIIDTLWDWNSNRVHDLLNYGRAEISRVLKTRLRAATKNVWTDEPYGLRRDGVDAM